MEVTSQKLPNFLKGSGQEALTHLSPIVPFLHPLKMSEKPSQPAISCSKLTIETREQDCEICWKLTIKIPERRHWSCFSVFIVNFEHISHLFLVFLLLTLSWQMPAGLVFLMFSGVKKWNIGLNCVKKTYWFQRFTEKVYQPRNFWKGNTRIFRLP